MDKKVVREEQVKRYAIRLKRYGYREYARLYVGIYKKVAIGRTTNANFKTPILVGSEEEAKKVLEENGLGTYLWYLEDTAMNVGCLR